jgi:hypothetical protein
VGRSINGNDPQEQTFILKTTVMKCVTDFFSTLQRLQLRVFFLIFVLLVTQVRSIRGGVFPEPHNTIQSFVM